MSGGATPQQQYGSTSQNQTQSGTSTSGPSPNLQGMLQGLANTIYGNYAGLPGGSSVPAQSGLTQNYQNLENANATTGTGANLYGTAANYATNILNGGNLNLANNPYFQGAVSAELQPLTQNFNTNVVPGIQSLMASAGRPGANGADSTLLNNALTNFNTSNANAVAQQGENAYQSLLGQQASVMGMVPSLMGGYQNVLSGLGQAGQGLDLYNQMSLLSPLATAGGVGSMLLGTYPGGTTSSSGTTSGYGSSSSYMTPSTNPTASLLGGALGLGGLGLQAYSVLSDRRDKTDVDELGVDPLTGLKMYSYRYKSDPKTYPKVVGPMAQDIEESTGRRMPEIGGRKLVPMAMLQGPAMPAGGLF
jgi:hypothetical protein